MSERQPIKDKQTVEEQFMKEYVISTADKTLEQGPYVDGFSSRTLLGALFVAIVMMPSAVYLGLVAGQALGGAAEWVTIILFTEVARRSFTQLKRQEVYVLFYVASSVAAVTLMHLALSGGPIALTIWNQYLLQSPQTVGIADQIPDWVVPGADSAGILERNLAHVDWWWSQSRGFLSPIILISFGYMFGRLAWFAFGYILFRITSDRERLPFPLAPIAAQGATALAEATDRDEASESGKRSWRWEVFSLGATLGIAFGVIYIMVPVTTGLFMTRPLMILPIPFIDFTRSVESFMPTSLISVSFDAVGFMAGMILPFKLVLGIVTSVLLTSVFGNPILYRLGVFEHWTPGNGLLVNQLILSFDFWMSVTIGMALSVAIIGIRFVVMNIVKSLRTDKAALQQQREEEEKARNLGPDEPPYRRPSRERGDFPIWVAAGLFLIAMLAFTYVSHRLVPGFPIWIFLVFGFIWTPIHSYVSARLFGLTGQGLIMPYLRETAFIASGYKGVDIWFVPTIPLLDVGPSAQRFRELELTRTKFTSIIKAELVMLPIVFVTSFLFWWFFWRMNQIPSDQFPFVARTWPVAARQAYLIFTANVTEDSLLLQALKPSIIGGAGVFGLCLYGLLSVFKMPVVFFYGMVGGIGQPLHFALPMFVGACASRYYFSKKFPEQKWYRSVPVLAAGFSCGMGLAGMIAAALALIAQCTRALPF